MKLGELSAYTLVHSSLGIFNTLVGNAWLLVLLYMSMMTGFRCVILLCEASVLQM